jgi:hypothetical protein
MNTTAANQKAKTIRPQKSDRNYRILRWNEDPWRSISIIAQVYLANKRIARASNTLNDKNAKFEPETSAFPTIAAKHRAAGPPTNTSRRSNDANPLPLVAELCENFNDL